MADLRTGQCLCGNVTYRAEGLRDIWYCHCRQCRHVTGHYMAACRTGNGELDWDGLISWTPHSGSSELARCRQCGTPLFWRQRAGKTISVLAGSLDDTAGLATPGHIFTAEKGDYYDVTDGLPAWPGQPSGGC
ncbi:GFA family protein [Paraurantiacibacter namhicola]|uniref:Glutathione-dependent formaldehyde-activating enzyme n=1 Tax=Paraurantiacibacter namhicola TaxID=645517 RepID=A0A1C7D4R8_9SPHN|nr:GFA family protein [Paraurantiacibacter namhicola]ANU06454.1 Glutathione-dependent formaldehyde-activating enzyme [Paraurantiacibacter namhicola]